MKRGKDMRVLEKKRVNQAVALASVGFARDEAWNFARAAMRCPDDYVIANLGSGNGAVFIRHGDGSFAMFRTPLAPGTPEKVDAALGRLMDAIAHLTDALSAIEECDLLNLCAVMGSKSDVIPGLLAWIEHAVTWEMDRRAGSVYPILSPHIAVDEVEASVAMLGAVGLRLYDRERWTSGERLFHFLALTSAILCAEDERTRTSH